MSEVENVKKENEELNAENKNNVDIILEEF